MRCSIRPTFQLALALAALTALAVGCSGSTTKQALQKDINAQIQARLPAITACYKDALERDKTIQGTMTLDFSIPKDSVQVSPVGVTTEIKDAALKQCVQEKAQGLKLAEPFHRPVKATYPLAFTPL